MGIYLKESQEPAQACVIWMHGLGADSSDMIGLVEQLTIDDVALRHVFIDAPIRAVTLNAGMIMPAWYDILGMELVSKEDKEGIEESELLIRQVIETQIKNGFAYKQIFLAGFSQGGAMALHTALNMETRLGGVIALSAYLPLAKTAKPVLDKTTPFFIASGEFDPLVLPKWNQQTRDWLLAKGYNNISFNQYPMEHSICFEEIKEISLWLNTQAQGVL